MLKANIIELQKEFQSVNDILDQFSIENFDQIIKNVKSSIVKISKSKEELSKIYSSKELKSFNVEFEALIKQINNKFDNIINRVKNEQAEIGKQLANLNNQKKLTAYNR